MDRSHDGYDLCCGVPKRIIIDISFTFSRTPGQPKRYVQDALRERAADLVPLLQDPNACFYVCGLKAMEEAVVLALRDIRGRGAYALAALVFAGAAVAGFMERQGRDATPTPRESTAMIVPRTWNPC